MTLEWQAAPHSVEIHGLRCLIALVEEQHFRRAAERLRMTESALAQTVRSLEIALGVSLLRRHSPELTPTPSGVLLAEHGRGIIAALDLAVAEARRAGGLSATVRLGCAPDVPVQRLQALLGALGAYEPELMVEVTHLRTTEQFRRLERGELHLAVAHDVADDGVQSVPVFVGERLDALVPVGHPLTARRVLGPVDFDDEILLVAPYASDPALDDRLVATLEEAGYRFLGVRETTGDDLRDLLFAVADGKGVVIGPRSALALPGDLGPQVESRPLEPVLRMPDTMLAWRTKPPLHLSGLLDAAREIAAELYRYSNDNGP